MKTIIAVPGHFHAFQLAKQLYQRDCLSKLFTTYPIRYAEQVNLPRNLVFTYPYFEVCKRIFKRSHSWVRSHFDKLVASQLTEADIFVGWSGGMSQSLKRAKSLGMMTIIERGSTHILEQKRILEKEYQKFGLSIDHLINDEVVEKELLDYELCDYIFIPSTFVKSTFIKRGVPERKLCVTPYGSDFKSQPTSKVKNDDFIVTYCGSCCFRKGAHLLLEAFEQLKLSHSKLYMIGHMDREFAPFARRYRQDNIIFTGSLNKTEMIKRLSVSNIFCLPSLEEGLAMVVLEAMSCGVAVICTPQTGAEDVISNEKDGFIIDGSIESIQEKILLLYRNRTLCDTVGEAARKTASAGFTWAHYGDRIARHYREILAVKESGLVANLNAQSN